jgi:hypothetical protein
MIKFLHNLASFWVKNANFFEGFDMHSEAELLDGIFSNQKSLFG